ncbi:URC4/urg3 family protein [Ramlibacter sp. MAHUQ-53]|uniref:URC4/urg3 family protein n=1 Tax=unclassified Ramlibacter TaxID=2617605 RepID=UPI0036357C34
MNDAMAFTDPHAEGAIAAGVLRTTQAVRERSAQLLARARRGGSGWFEVDDAALDGAAARVAGTTRERHPHLRVPLHSRWRHFEAGGVDRRRQLEALLAGQTAVTRIHAMIDLTVTSVLLDAGAGADWKYTETATGRQYTRSEGLAVASFHAFCAGLFSSDRDRPLQADARGLRALATDHLAQAFQVTPTNPLVGLEGRAILLRRLGEVMTEQPEVFGEDGRPGGLFDMIISPLGPGTPPPTADVQAHDILSQLLAALSGIWPADNRIGGVPLGDCWRHPAVRGDGATDGWVPFHKLSQWLTYSLLEPFEWGGVKVHGTDRLTGLPEYRNGGLMIDSGVLRLRNPLAAAQTWAPGDEIIVEWRALTVALLDELAPRVREQLNTDAAHLPLGRLLEGGTWAAGRELAQQLRGGLPPLRVASDGTVF